MSLDDLEFRIRPGRSRDVGRGSRKKVQRLVAQVRRAAANAGFVRRGPTSGRGTGASGRGRIARLRAGIAAGQRRVVIKARVVRHTGARFRAAPLGRHLTYLKRDGVGRDGRDGALFDAGAEPADGVAFATRCEGDRHHFRFIVSPEDAGDLADIRAFTRELVDDMARDLGTRLDWVAVDHWNTDNPHVHLLVRGVVEDGSDLVIDRDYIRTGMRGRAQDRVTVELGPRSERDIQTALEREVDAERWTSLDRSLCRLTDEVTGVVDLRPGGDDDPGLRRLLIGRAATLERLGLAVADGPAAWTIRPDAEPVLRDLAIRTDVIETMHRAMTEAGHRADPEAFALHEGSPRDGIVGRLVERGLHDELAGTAYAVVDGVDGRLHHVRFDTIELTGDARPGAIVELRTWTDARGQDRRSLAVRSDLSLEAQTTASGATWIDHQLVAREPVALGSGFGAEVRGAMATRAGHLADIGLARRQSGGTVFARDLVTTLRNRDLDAEVGRIGQDLGLRHRPSATGDTIAGTYRRRVDLASGRFALIDDGLGFQLVPWRPALDQHVGAHVTGTMSPSGVDWRLGRSRGLGL